MKETQRVAIVGASYAGLVAAKILGEHGIETEVFERKRDVRGFACGEEFTRGFGIGPPPKEVTFASLNKIVMYLGNGDAAIFNLPADTLFLVDRARFQEWLYKCTDKRYVSFRFGARAKISHLRDEYDWVIDASGYPSQSSKEGFTDKIGERAIAVFYRIKGDVLGDYEYGKIYGWWLVPDEFGFAWLFPQSEKQANVGIGWDITKSKPPKFGDLDGFISEKVTEDYEILLRGGGVMPLDYDKSLVYDNVVLAGDAAGLKNFVAGEGGRFALSSGKAAAEAVACGDIDYYKRFCESIILPEVKGSRFALRTARHLRRSVFGYAMKCIASEFDYFMRIFYRSNTENIMWIFKKLVKKGVYE